MPKARYQGFTLIEMSIVLVIIGLIVGGVLVGQSLIQAAALRATVTQIERFNTAVNTFRGKFDCIPGDCANAVSFGLGTSGGPGDNGDGNGTIYVWGDMFGWAWSFQQENLNVWYHLSRAGLIEGGYAGYTPTAPASMTGYLPATRLSDSVYISMMALSWNPASPIAGGYWAPNGFYISGVVTGASGYYSNGLTPAQALAIDQKIDDGSPLTGNVAVGYNYAGPDMGDVLTGGTCGCTVCGFFPVVYNTSSSTGACILGIRAQ